MTLKEQILEEFDKEWPIFLTSQDRLISSLVKDFISQALDRQRDEIMQKNIDYLKKLCWSDKDIEYFLMQYDNL